MPFAIRYYRNEEWSRRFEMAGLDKPPGYTTSPMPPYRERRHAQDVADHINGLKPEQPCTVVPVPMAQHGGANTYTKPSAYQ